MASVTQTQAPNKVERAAIYPRVSTGQQEDDRSFDRNGGRFL